MRARRSAPSAAYPSARSFTPDLFPPDLFPPSSADPLSNMVLSFSSKEDAVAFAEKNGNDQTLRAAQTRTGRGGEGLVPSLIKALEATPPPFFFFFTTALEQLACWGKTAVEQGGERVQPVQTGTEHKAKGELYPSPP